MEGDENIARKLQAQFDEEDESAEEVIKMDEALAQKLSSSSHQLSDSDDEMPVTKTGTGGYRLSGESDTSVSNSNRKSSIMSSEDEGASSNKRKEPATKEPAYHITPLAQRFRSQRDDVPLDPEEIRKKRLARLTAFGQKDKTPPVPKPIPSSSFSTPSKSPKKDKSLKNSSSEKKLSSNSPVESKIKKDSIKNSPPSENKSSSASSVDSKIKKDPMSESDYKSRKRPRCQFGSECYRKNPQHLEEFYHPNREDKSPKDSQAGSSKRTKETETSVQPKEPAEKKRKVPDASCEKKQISPQLPFLERLSASSPFNFFLNKSFTVKATHSDPLSLVLPDLLNKRMGEIVESAQLTFMCDLDFLMAMYKACGLEDRPLLLMFGKMEGNPRNYKNLTATRVNLPFQYGTHHTKMMLLQYTNGMRIVIHTANLVTDDWFEKTQGFWVSPLFPPLEGDKSSILDGESPTRFKRDLVDYLQSYKAPDLTRWSHIIKKYDFTDCNAIFVGSSPGYHMGEARDKWGHMKVRKAIKQHTPVWKSSVPVISQCSSIGSLGKDNKTWLSTELGVSLTGNAIPTASPPTMHIVYPSEDDIRNSSQGYGGGSCLPYNSQTHAKQTWFRDHLHCWKSNTRKRTGVMPHIKTYTRISKDNSQAQYFLLTSSNLSKAAWGQLQKQGSQLFIRSYEAGVLLLPKFLTSSSEFNLSSADPSSVLHLPYDVPLTTYPKDAKPWFMDTEKSKTDNFGNTYP